MSVFMPRSVTRTFVCSAFSARPSVHTHDALRTRRQLHNTAAATAAAAADDEDDADDIDDDNDDSDQR